MHKSAFWSNIESDDSNSIQLHVRQTRLALEISGACPQIINTIETRRSRTRVARVTLDRSNVAHAHIAIVLYIGHMHVGICFLHTKQPVAYRNNDRAHMHIYRYYRVVLWPENGERSRARALCSAHFCILSIQVRTQLLFVPSVQPHSR